jgi:hypothetical protein
MMELERETIDRMHAGPGQHPEFVTESTRDAIARKYDHLNESQRTCPGDYDESRSALEGAAGAGRRRRSQRFAMRRNGRVTRSRASHGVDATRGTVGGG